MLRLAPTRTSVRSWIVLLVLLVYVMAAGCPKQIPPPVSAPPPPPIPMFPWPPPPASATEVLPNAMFEKSAPLKTLGDLNNALLRGLQSTGYFEKSYYAVPDGYVLATRLEQISEDGTSKASPARWSAAAPRVEHFSISDYLRALLTANPGFYRVVVFVVTDVPFTESGKPASVADAQKWLTGGANVLPISIANASFGTNTVCTALIYEFTRNAGEGPTQLLPSPLDAHTHLIKSGLWNAFGGNP